MKRKYHGWIWRDEIEHTFKVGFKSGPNQIVLDTGDGEEGAHKAVYVFEVKLGLGTVKLEQTIAGLRVYTEEETDIPDGFDSDCEVCGEHFIANKPRMVVCSACAQEAEETK